ncbi:growth hormone-regulated TBC protein 1 [Thraustotheca clavata]|uniref:Growth hormone-regulated TBC protein 1 n=1 Tax=Thraustotheca clavata TaxID=74557 RepID=A0A1V9YS02_9STRA|nr:growth hormone-regulated TBC protein 1 [Thraustotheca clavata]
MPRIRRTKYENEAIAVYDIEFDEGTIGIRFETDFYGKHALVKSLVEGSQADGIFLQDNHAIKAHAIQPGHVLVAVNGTDVVNQPFKNIMQCIKMAKVPKTLRFLDPNVLSIEKFSKDPNMQQLVNRDDFGFVKDDAYILKHRRAQKYKKWRFRNDKQWLDLIMQYGGADKLNESFNKGTLTEQTQLRERMEPLIVGGIPASHRPAIWKILGNTKEYQDRYSQRYYQELLKSDHRYSTLTDIEKDVGRTYPEHAFFQEDKGKVELTNVLTAYAVHRSDIGYCQSMNFIVGILVLFLPEEDAFWILCVLMDHILPSENYSRSMFGAQVDQIVFKRLVQLQVPDIAALLEENGIDIELVSLQWFLCIFVCTLPLETALRIWDLIFFYGQEIIFDTAISILHYAQQGILEADSYTSLFQCVRELGTDLHDADNFIEFVYAFMNHEARKSPLDLLVNKFNKLFDKPFPIDIIPKQYSMDDINQWRREARPQSFVIKIFLLDIKLSFLILINMWKMDRLEERINGLCGGSPTALDELVRLCEELELVAMSTRVAPMDASFYSLFFMALLTLGRLDEARHLWKRLPYKQLNGFAQIWAVGQALWKRDIIQAHAAASALDSVVLDVKVTPLVAELKRSIQHSIAILISQAYTNLPIENVAAALGLSGKATMEFCAKCGWRIEGNLVYPAKMAMVSTNAIELDELQHLSNYVLHLEQRSIMKV